MVPISTSEARGAVEKWLLQVQEGMLASVRDVVKRSREVNHQHYYTPDSSGFSAVIRYFYDTQSSLGIIRIKHDDDDDDQ